MEEHPLLKPTDHLKFALRNGDLGEFVGSSRQESVIDIRGKLADFWDNFRAVYPNHQIFQHGYDLSGVIPTYVHGDEGRGRKHNGVMVLSLQGAIGKGTRHSIRKRIWKPKQKRWIGMNFAGHSFLTRMLFSVMPKFMYSDNPVVFKDLLVHLIDDLDEAFHEGVVFQGHTWRLANFGVKGDLPFVVKVGSFKRSFSHVPKQASSKAPCVGICHRCMGGCPDVPFEDVNDSCEWLLTVGHEEPWTELPDILRLVHNPDDPTDVFKFDIFHLWHCGLGENFFASVIVLMIPCFPYNKVERCLEAATASFKLRCKTKRFSPSLRTITVCC
ncbi:unnamed protein product [Polarella glacialis]|uniref:Uncharacterized protein n=1 Tax=Polarella glacialis TaxID=89957 RepID=A0A813IMW1_POLGL|nr:unnamed protein product [Polarella glacialis]